MTTMNEPSDIVYEKITGYHLDDIIPLFSSKKDLIILKSAMLMNHHGRYSFICFDAFATFSAKARKYLWNNQAIELNQPFEFINKKINEYKIKKNPRLPLFQGGVVGYFGYEASHYLEELPQAIDGIQLPDIFLNFYSSAIQYDHVSNEMFIVSTGFPEKIREQRMQTARKNIAEIKRFISNHSHYKRCQNNKETNRLTENIRSNFTETNYISAVNDIKKYILEGDIFEANLSQQFKVLLPKPFNAFTLYCKLNVMNPAPYSAFINIPEQGSIISASPERFIKNENNTVETYPIKGTRKRSLNPEEDKQLVTELLNSEKDHAENVMIVDLMRNDLSKVCLPGSVTVDELCALRSYPSVHHLVSKISGTLKKEKNSVDLLKATFPPGSVTGAPKIRAMEIISELENDTRGPYCGCIGYLSFTGDMDTSVIIRTYFINKTHIYFGAGGAIVLDSDPQEEYLESITKATALVEALS